MCVKLDLVTQILDIHVHFVGIPNLPHNYIQCSPSLPLFPGCVPAQLPHTDQLPSAPPCSSWIRNVEKRSPHFHSPRRSHESTVHV